MKATKLTAEQLRVDDGREYNPTIWEQKIDSYSKYSDVQFYKVNRGDGYEYDRYFVSYTLPEGLRLLNTFGYSSSITNGGFQEAVITDFDIENMKPFENDQVAIFGHKVRVDDGNGNIVESWINTTPAAREWMTQRSKQFGCIYTKLGL